MLFTMDQCFVRDAWQPQDQEKYTTHCDTCRISIAATLDAIENDWIIKWLL